MTRKNETCLVIPDIHQHIDWADRILSREGDAADRIVLLGDYFDPKVEKAGSAKETTIFIQRLAKRFRGRISFLVGNHDLPYLYDFQNPSSLERGQINPYSCSGYKTDRSRKIVSKLKAEFVSLLQPFVVAHGFLISHAGLHADHLTSIQSPTLQDLESLRLSLKGDLANLANRISAPLAAVSPVRGGTDPIGGITWLDWHREFEDSLPWPQIVGHTIQDQSPAQKGRSWNIDTRVGHYALLSDAGVKVKSEPKVPNRRA